MRPFQRLLSISTLTQLSDEIVSAKIILPWLFVILGAPAWMLSLLVPLKESGALLPQWSVQRVLKARFTTAYIWRTGMLVQGCSILCLLVILSFFVKGSDLPSFLLYLALVCVGTGSLGRALCSFTIKDIQAHNIAKGERGKLIGAGGSLAGLTTIGVALLLLSVGNTSQQIETVLQLMLLGGVSCYGISLLLSLRLQMPNAKRDEEQEIHKDAPPFAGTDLHINTEHQTNPHAQTKVSPSNKQLDTSNKPHLLAYWLAHRDLRQIVYARLFLLHGALAMPFMLLWLLDNTLSDKQFTQLPLALLVSAFASFLAAYVWGLFADRSARTTQAIAGGCCALSILGLAMLDSSLRAGQQGMSGSVEFLAESFQYQTVIAFVLFFAANLAYAGVRTARKTYLIDAVTTSVRQQHVAAGNTLVGIGLLGLGSGWAFIYSYVPDITLFALGCVVGLGALYSLRLPSDK